MRTLSEYKLRPEGAAMAKLVRILKHERSILLQNMMQHQDKRQSIIYEDLDIDPTIGDQKMLKMEVTNLLNEMHKQGVIDINLTA